MKKLIFWSAILIGILFATSPIVNSNISDICIRGIAMSLEVIVGVPIGVYASNKISRCVEDLMVVKERA